MNFSYGSFQLFSKIEAMQPNLLSELGQYVLDFEVRFSPNNPSAPQYPRNGALIVDDLEVCVALRTNQKVIGIAYPSAATGGQGTISIKPQSRQVDVSVRFHLFLTPGILEAVESARNGGDLLLALKLSGKITGYDSYENERLDLSDVTWGGENLWNAAPARVYKPQHNFFDLTATVLQSRWVELLTRAGFAKSILIEIPILESDEFNTASAHIREAQLAFAQGRYADVVARCRDAMDALIEKSSYPWRELGSKEWRENMAVEDRLRLGWTAIRHITHATHHRNGMKGEFTRPMAQYVLGSTCLTLSLAARENDLFMRPVSSPDI